MATIEARCIDTSFGTTRTLQDVSITVMERGRSGLRCYQIYNHDCISLTGRTT
ncbi:MAG: hypothetical protein ACMUIE_00820 [Thermoplasmatota archaeon]